MTASVQPLDPMTTGLTRRVLLEIRHVRIRCDLAIVEIDGASELLAARDIAPEAALGILDDRTDELAGVRP